MKLRNQLILVQFLYNYVLLLRFPVVETTMLKYSVAHSICYQQKIFTHSETRKGQILEPLKEPLQETILRRGGRCVWFKWEKTCESGPGCSTFVKKSCKELGLLPWTNSTATGTERIAGGEVIVPDSYPSYGRMWEDGNAESGYFRGCGFTILNENWGLSAGHCYYPGLDFYAGILVGRQNESEPEEGEQWRRLDQLIVYPDTPKTPSGRKKDLMLLHWAEPLKLDGKKAAAAKLTDKPIDQGQLTLVGVGYFIPGEETASEVPREVTIPIIPDQECTDRISPPGVSPDVWLICVGKSESGQSACQGDSGGPMYTIGEDNTQYLTGVVSFGSSQTSPACGSPTVITGGVEVYHFLEWINKTINNMTNENS